MGGVRGSWGVYEGRGVYEGHGGDTTLFLRVNVKRKIQERTFNNKNVIIIPGTTLFSNVP